MDNSKYIAEFYNSYNEDERLASRHGLVEYLTTMNYIKKYIKQGAHVLEIGAGTGRYSHSLAREGYTVDAVELVEHNIDVFKRNTQSNEAISITKGNALDLSVFPDETYDITLLLGPLYHLYNDDDKRKALSEAIRVTKKNGVIFAAYVISDGCLLDEGFHRENISVVNYLEQGLIDPITFATQSEPKDLFDLMRKEEIDQVMNAFSVTRLHYVATDGVALLMRESVDAMSDDVFGLYLKYHLATCEREDLVGVTSHALDIFKKCEPVNKGDKDYE